MQRWLKVAIVKFVRIFVISKHLINSAPALVLVFRSRAVFGRQVLGQKFLALFLVDCVVVGLRP